MPVAVPCAVAVPVWCIALGAPAHPNEVYTGSDVGVVTEPRSAVWYHGASTPTHGG